MYTQYGNITIWTEVDTETPLTKRYFTVFGAGLVFLAILLASTRPSGASESDEIVTEGYQGSERIIVVEKPVEGKSGIAQKKGWIGDKRIDLKVIRTNEYTETRGWVDGEYIHIKERKKNEICRTYGN